MKTETERRKGRNHKELWGGKTKKNNGSLQRRQEKDSSQTDLHLLQLLSTSDQPNILFEFSFLLKVLISAILIVVTHLFFLFEVSLSSLLLSHTAPHLGIAGFFLLPAPFFHSLIQRCLVPWSMRGVYHNISCSHFSLSGELLGSFI